MTYGTIGIIGAMAEELELLFRSAEMGEETRKAGMTFRRGTLHGQPILAVKSGVGKVNAAVCTQALVDLGADCVLFTGVAGAIDPELRIGDIVVSTACIQHDMDVTALGFGPGVIPYQEVSVFPADAELVELAAEAGQSAAKGKAIRGIVLSGDQFIASRDKVQQLRGQLRRSLRRDGGRGGRSSLPSQRGAVCRHPVDVRSGGRQRAYEFRGIHDAGREPVVPSHRRDDPPPQPRLSAISRPAAAGLREEAGGCFLACRHQ